MSNLKSTTTAQESANKDHALPAKNCDWGLTKTLFIAIGIPGVPAIGQVLYGFWGPLFVTTLAGLACGFVAVAVVKLLRSRSKSA